jgi:hypothetical protein
MASVAKKAALNQDDGPVHSLRLHGMRARLAAVAGANFTTLASHVQLRVLLAPMGRRERRTRAIGKGRNEDAERGMLESVAAHRTWGHGAGRFRMVPRCGDAGMDLGRNDGFADVGGLQ